MFVSDGIATGMLRRSLEGVIILGREQDTKSRIEDILRDDQ